jgi:hypothetical protein
MVVSPPPDSSRPAAVFPTRLCAVPLQPVPPDGTSHAAAQVPVMPLHPRRDLPPHTALPGLKLMLEHTDRPSWTDNQIRGSERVGLRWLWPALIFWL